MDAKEPSNEDLVTAFKNRDAKAFAYIFRLHYRPLCYFAEKMLGDRQEAEDIVADKFMKLWDKHADFDSFSSIKAFLYISTRNGCLDFLKYSKRLSASQKEFSYWADNKETEILHLMFEAELLQELVKEIESLPKTCRQIFELSFFGQLNSNEVAAKTGLSVKTVRNQKAKAAQLIKLAFLKKNLGVFIISFSCISQRFLFF